MPSSGSTQARAKRVVRRRSIIEVERVPIPPIAGVLRKLSKQGWWQVRTVDSAA